MPTIEVPILETERLRLREGRKEDFSAFAAMWRDPVILRYTTRRALSPEEAWTKSLRNAGLWPMLGYGYWAVEEKASGEFVGELGFADFKREIEPSLAGIPEAGWVLISRVHGRGYATEALGAAVTWGDWPARYLVPVGELV
jgi:RimJ/RimL family protein N-acetyltransferase